MSPSLRLTNREDLSKSLQFDGLDSVPYEIVHHNISKRQQQTTRLLVQRLAILGLGASTLLGCDGTSSLDVTGTGEGTNGDAITTSSSTGGTSGGEAGSSGTTGEGGCTSKIPSIEVTKIKGNENEGIDIISSDPPSYLKFAFEFKPYDCFPPNYEDFPILESLKFNFNGTGKFENVMDNPRLINRIDNDEINFDCIPDINTESITCSGLNVAPLIGIIVELKTQFKFDPDINEQCDKDYGFEITDPSSVIFSDISGQTIPSSNILGNFPVQWLKRQVKCD